MIKKIIQYFFALFKILMRNFDLSIYKNITWCIK